MKIGMEKRLPRGMTLTEVMIATAFLSLMALATIRVFQTTLVGVHLTKQPTVAHDLLAERLDAIRRLNADFLLLSESTTTLPGYSPSVCSDATKYPPETQRVENVDYTIHTCTRLIRHRESGELAVFAAPGDWQAPSVRVMMAITWQDARGVNRQIQGNCDIPRRYVQITRVTGTVESTTGIPLYHAQMISKSATVPPSYRHLGYTDTAGQYDFSINGGSFTLTAIATGYRSKDILVNFDRNAPTVVQDFSLVPLAAATAVATGQVWVATSPVISMVAGDLLNGGIHQEFVEIYYPLNIYTGLSSANFGLRIQRRPSQDAAARPIQIRYLRTQANKESYFLFANTSPVVVGGVSRNADAVWDDAAGSTNYTFTWFGSQRRVIPVVSDDPANEGTAGLELYNPITGDVYDRFGWKGAFAEDPGLYEGTPLSDATGGGLTSGEAYRRFSSPAGVHGSMTPNYDTDDNSQNWSVGAAIPPRTGANYAQPTGGRPAVGAHVWVVDDPYSPIVQTSLDTCSGRPCATFSIPQVSSGDVWLDAVIGGATEADSYGISSGNNALADVAAGSTRTINFALNYNMSSSVDPFIASGYVRDSGGAPLAGVRMGNKESRADGSYDATVEYGRLMMTDPLGRFGDRSLSLAYPAGGHASGLDVTPTQGAMVRWTTLLWDGYTPTAAYSFQLNETLSGTEYGIMGQEGDGSFQLWLETGTYNVSFHPLGSLVPNKPVTDWEGGTYYLDMPSSINVPATAAGTTVFLSTYTLRPRDGWIRGRMTCGGAPVTEGVLVAALASPTTLAAGSGPPTAAADNNVSFFGGRRTIRAFSDGAGYYAMKVPPRTYNLYAWRTDGRRVTVRQDHLGVVVGTAAVVAEDFSW